MASVTCVVLEVAPAVAVTARVALEGVAPETEITTCWDVFGASVKLLGATLTPAGAPETWTVTGEVKPGSALSRTETVTGEFGETTPDEAVAVIVNEEFDGDGVTTPPPPPEDDPPPPPPHEASRTAHPRTKDKARVRTKRPQVTVRIGFGIQGAMNNLGSASCQYHLTRSLASIAKRPIP